MDEGDDLYGDLDEGVGVMPSLKAPFQPLQAYDTREEVFRKKEIELTSKVESLKNELDLQVEALQQDKAVLIRNISCLFKTAQMELARKDKQMKELREENLRFKLGGARGPANVRAVLTRAGDKTNGQSKLSIDQIPHNSRITGSSDEDRRLHDSAGGAIDRVAQVALSIQSAKTGQRSTPEGSMVDGALELSVEMDSNVPSNIRKKPDSLGSQSIVENAGSDGYRVISDERKKQRRSPSRGNHHRDTNLADGGDQHSKGYFCNDKDDRSRSDRQRRDGRRNGDDGRSRHRSPDRNWDGSRSATADRDHRRIDNYLRNSNKRKRHRSSSRERERRLKDRESSRAAKTLSTNDSEFSRERERERDYSNRHQM
ncbi:uncharacterized protein [Physcomitrium patens]|uniref:uncharacterized protein isoform X2 n=1 Tax=Physcomitrium patens TaxID=3218 RepID=UPI000D153326|nr:uncharacterized protein DDB_G0287625-like isoform X2 [Physcomitrium patens]|eukprot:XP_024384582.1 uncharacterized protein DDB_G0287625-like isoform X2 [Physcomitrella patens]